MAAKLSVKSGGILGRKEHRTDRSPSCSISNLILFINNSYSSLPPLTP